MPDKIIEALLQKGFRPLTGEEKERNCEVGKLETRKSLKVGVYPHPKLTGMITVSTVFEEKGYERQNDWALLKEKEFPSSTPVEEIVDYVMGNGPSTIEY
jgi:hypothetical protein